MSGSDAGVEQSNPSHDVYDQWVGRVLDGRYRIEGLLGEGGMGAVFVGEHLKLLKKVAIKVIHPQFAGDGDVAERFAREAVAAGQLEHPNVASATDYGTLAEGGAYLVMQYVRGKSLRDVLDEDGPPGWARACEIGAQVADALAAAHQKGYVHRDLKPDNVMLEARDDGAPLVKVLDFGIARVASEKAVGAGGRTLTRVGTVIGTPGYMAPEQALGEPVDYRADLYAFGLVMHELITGRRVFDEKELTAIVTRQLTETPPRLSSIVGGIPAELDDLVARLLERDKDARPQAASEVRETLEALVLGAKLQAVASGEHEVAGLGPVELGVAAREPATLGGASGTRRPKVVTPQAVAATVAVTTAERPAAKARAASTVRLARELGEQVKTLVAKVGVPLPMLGIAAGAFLVGAALVVAITIALTGDARDPAVRKMVHDEPLPLRVEDEKEDEDEAPAAQSLVPVPAALAQAAFDLLNADASRKRNRAARAVLDHQPREEVPPFLVALAELENATACRRKQEQVRALAAIGDPRALPALDRLASEPRDGCRRLFRRYDCYQCLRDDLAATITSLQARLAD